MADANIPAGTFVPWNPARAHYKASARVGWIVAENGCHIWQAERNHNGYGRVGVNGQTRRVHRVRYEQEIGPIPAGMQLDHFVCDNGPGGCCNPHHCRPVTHRENILRCNSIAALNLAKTHCPQGHPLSGDNLIASEPVGRKCRTCALTRRRRYNALHSEERCLKQKAYVAANRERVLANQRAAYHRRKHATGQTP